MSTTPAVVRSADVPANLDRSRRVRTTPAAVRKELAVSSASPPPYVVHSAAVPNSTEGVA